MEAERQLSQLSESEIKLLFENHIEKNYIFDVKFNELIYFPYWFVKVEVPNYLERAELTGLVNALLKEQGVRKRKAEKAKASDVIAVVCWVRTMLKRIAELEANFLVGDPDPDMQAAGSKELDEFGELNTIDRLAGGDLLKYPEAKRIPYNEVFDKLRMDMVRGKIEKRYSEIKTKKAKGR